MTTPRRTILQIVPQLDAGGAELSAIEITEAIVRAGGVALVATEGGRMADRVTAAGGELVIMPVASKNPLTLWSNVGRLAHVIATRNVDLVHARSRAPAWSGLWAAQRTRKPFVTTYHGAYGETNAIKRRYNSVMARGDRVIANSNYTRQLIQTRYGTPDARLTVIHRGIDPSQFDPALVSDARKQALRSRFGLTSGERVVLLAARLTGWKGQAVLIDAMRRLNGAGSMGGVVAILAGDAQGRDGYVERLRTDIHAGGLDDNVRIVGHVDDIAAAFAIADVSVVASTEPEAFGRSAAEAQAMCCPVIATRIGAPQETVLAEPEVERERITGWLVPPGDADALAACLDHCLRLPVAEHRAIGERARAHVLRSFTLEAMKHATLCVYDDLLGSELAPAFAKTPGFVRSATHIRSP